MLFLLIFILCARRNISSKNHISKISAVSLAGGLAIILTYMIMIITPTIHVYSLHGIAYNIAAMCLLSYAIEFDCCDNDKRNRNYKLIQIFSTIITCINIALLAIGCVSPENAIYFHTIGDNINLVETYYPNIMLYNIAIWFPVVMACVILFLKKMTSPEFYKEPYNVLIIAAVCTIMCELWYLKFNSKPSTINIAVIGLPIEGVLMHHYSTEHRFDSLIRKSNDAVMDALNDGFILLDKNKKIIYKNRSVKKIFETDYACGIVLDLFKSNIKHSNEFSNTIYMVKSNDGNDEANRYIDISYQSINDERGKYVGSYFLLHDATILEKSRRKNEFIAKHSALTGLYNKNEFCEKAKVKALINRNEVYILMLLNIDKFKMINELFGNETGDSILRKIADAIRTYTGDNCIFGHLNDDKFVIMMPNKEYNENAFFKALHKNLKIEQDDDYKITIHAGICDISSDDYDEDDINVPLFIDRAVLALADIKGDMQTRTATYGPHITKTIIEQQKIINEIDKALDNKNICFFIQPQTDMDGNSHGGEALVRWIDPERGIIYPGEFVPVLEEKGLISKVDLYVWDLVCCKLKEWKDNGWSDFYLSVNISAKDMYYMNIYDEFTSLINKYGISPSSLRLEVTESSVMLDKGRQFELLEKLRRFGFMIEIDDFGSGYSSLNMLKDIEFDMLKIDMEFLRETEHVEKSRRILKSVIQMAKSIGTQVITEGVETEEQLKFLIEAGCFNFQGYYFDRPMPVEKFEEKYLKEKRY